LTLKLCTHVFNSLRIVILQATRVIYVSQSPKSMVDTAVSVPLRAGSHCSWYEDDQLRSL